MLDVKRYPRESLRDEKGMVLVVALLLIAALVLLGTTAVMMSTTDMKISANYKTGNQAFYVAEAGVEEARARLKKFNPANSIAIVDEHDTQTGWTAYIGAETKATGKGFSISNAMHVRVPSLQSTLDYTVKIEHQKNAANQILYWGDDNNDGRYERTINRNNPTTGLLNPNIYLVTSYGSASGANRTIVAEVTRVSPLTVPAALYVEAATAILGNASIFGVDQCGGQSLPGIKTTLATTSVDDSNNPGSLITGVTSPTGIPSDISGYATSLDIQGMIDSQKGSANFIYNVVSAVQSGSTIPGPGDDWGMPTPGATNANASSCNDVPPKFPNRNIVYYNTSNGTNTTSIKLTNANGCGLLLVDGDLDINGGFSWCGLVIVSGSVKYTGGAGQNKNITGGVLAGGSATADIIGGNTNIVYCSSAVKTMTEYQSLLRLSWKEQNI
jgi:PilX N-terminal